MPRILACFDSLQPWEYDDGGIDDHGLSASAGMKRWPTINPINGEENPLYLLTDANFAGLAIKTAQHISLPTIQTHFGEWSPRVLSGSLASGDVFVTDPQTRTDLWQSLQADLIDMEGAAVVQVAQQLGVASVVIRSISDIDEHVDVDWETYFGMAVRDAAAVVAAMIAQID